MPSIHKFIAAMSLPLQAHGVPLLQVYARMMWRDQVDVFVFSDRMNRVYNNFLFTVITGAVVSAEAKVYYRNPKNNPIQLFDLGYPQLCALHDAYMKICGAVHRTAHRLRKLADDKARVLIRRARNDPADSLFLAAYAPGSPLSTVSGVGTGSNHGRVRTAYDIKTFDSTASNSMPQLLTPSIAVGQIHSITTSNQPVWAVAVSAGVRLVGSAVGGVLGGEAADAVGEAITRKSEPGQFVHDTASQLWEIGIDRKYGREHLTLRNIQSGFFLAPKPETLHTSLQDHLGPETCWLPILVDGRTHFASCIEDERMPFKLRNILDGRLLTSAGDLAVTCKGHLGEGGDHVLWQFLTETVLPPGTTLCPGCVVTSANQRYSLRYAASGALEIWDRSRKLREVELTRLEASSAGPGQVTLWPDGNLAQYDIHGRAIAISDTRRPNSVAVLTNDGWFQIVSPEGSILF